MGLAAVVVLVVVVMFASVKALTMGLRSPGVPAAASLAASAPVTTSAPIPTPTAPPRAPWSCDGSGKCSDGREKPKPCSLGRHAPIGYGEYGHDVKEVQRRLNDVAPPDGGPRRDLKVDGNFGTRTRNAVIKFQLAKRLGADGIVGSRTGCKLERSTTP